ncbi:MAG: hypothetical protein ACFFC7_27740 [Candidatus Hermodarchaeota archaeon]
MVTGTNVHIWNSRPLRNERLVTYLTTPSKDFPDIHVESEFRLKKVG